MRSLPKMRTEPDPVKTPRQVASEFGLGTPFSRKFSALARSGLLSHSVPAVIATLQGRPERATRSSSLRLAADCPSGETGDCSATEVNEPAAAERSPIEASERPE